MSTDFPKGQRGTNETESIEDLIDRALGKIRLEAPDVNQPEGIRVFDGEFEDDQPFIAVLAVGKQASTALTEWANQLYSDSLDDDPSGGPQVS